MPRKPKPKQQGWRAVYDDFISRTEIDSKEFGRTVLRLWGTQQYVLDEIASGMDEGIRFFIVTKGRQYGITTCLVPLDVLWMLTHPGIEGAFIGHKPDVCEIARSQVMDIQNRLPETHRVPIKTNNKDRIEWEFRDGTVSTLNLLVAGTTDRKSDLAKGHGLAIIHGSECGEWGSETAFNSLLASLAEQHPDRLYVFESTGEGSNNLFARLVRKSLDHPARKVIFPPWWLHDLYKLDRRSALFHHYMANPEPTDDERDIIEAARLSGHELTDAQLGWYRKKCDEQTNLEDMRKNYPSVLEDAFQLGGDAFVPRKPLHAARDSAQSKMFSAYRVVLGSDVSAMRIHPLGVGIDEEDGHVRGCDLRVWEEPKPRGVYAVSVVKSPKPEFASVIEVLRCYSDCVEQVAEFSSETIEAYQLAWVTAYLAGWYRDTWVNVELENAGGPVFRELNNLRNMASLGMLAQDDVFGAMIFYIYNRIDNVGGAARTWNWRYSPTTEAEIFTDFKNSFLTERALIHSLPLIEEMGTLVEEDGQVGADDGCDESRCRAMCIAIRTWVDHIRLAQHSNGRTREREQRADVGAAPATFLENIVTGFMRKQRAGVAR